MALAHAFDFAGGDQPVPGVLADRFQHRKARFAMGLGLLHQALADQRFQGLENTQRGFGIADRFDRFQGAASDKHGEPPEQFLFVRRRAGHGSNRSPRAAFSAVPAGRERRP